jgi:hypothetical protein
MPEVTMLRLYLLRAMYALMAIGLALLIWPLILASPSRPEHMQGVVWAMLGGLSLLAALGIRYPLRMLPILLFELVWKVLWVLAIYLPARAAGAVDAGTAQSLIDCLVGVVLLPLVIPWGYVWRHYVRAAGDPWRAPRSGL